MLSKAVILAAGLGTRMKEPYAGAILTPAQVEMADLGLKALIPIDRRPFLDYVISALADADYTKVCIVIREAQQLIHRYYTSTSPPARLDVAFAIQEEPRGTASAVLAAEQFAAADDFLMINSDNYYPPSALAALRALDEPGLIAFDRDGLLDGGNVTAERLQAYAAVVVGPDGYLEAIVEKPDADVVSRTRFISMNCWRFSSRIFPACREVSASSRGEFELADAVEHAMSALHVRFRAVPMTAPVLDLSNRSDVAPVSAVLERVVART